MTASVAQHPIGPGEQVVSVLEAARALGMTTAQIKSRIRSGELPAGRVAGRLVIPRAVIEAIRSQRSSKRL